MSLQQRIRAARQGDGGFVLVTVLITAAILSVLVTISLDTAIAQTRISRSDQDYSLALSAAEAGVDDYLSYLNNNDSYYEAAHPENTALYTTTAPALAAWPRVPGSSGAGGPRFVYQVGDGIPAHAVDAVNQTGSFTLTVKGFAGGTLKSDGTLSGGRTRTLRIQLRRPHFTDYVYFSDVEVNDPYSPYKYRTNSDAQRATTASNCAHYAWVTPAQAVPNDPHVQVRNAAPSCATIGWTNNDIVRGPFHTNDLPQVAGGIFQDRAEAGCPGTATDASGATVTSGCGTKNSSGVWTNYSGSGGTFAQGGMIAKGTLPLPLSNTDILKQAQQPNQGCLYTGPTRIILHGSTYDAYTSTAVGSDGVERPLSRATNGPACGTFTKTSQGYWAALNVPIPANGVVYVQNLPAAPSDPNYTDPSTLRTAYPYLTAPHPLAVPQGSTYRVSNSPPVNGTYSDTQGNQWPLPGDQTKYSASAGDAFVEGTLDGRLTIATAGDIIITGDTVYNDASATSDDLLGLVAQNSVWNYHPVNTANPPSGATLAGEQYEMCPASLKCMKNVTINGAVMSVTHGYGTQWPDNGSDLGIIHLTGSLTQEWRNNVGGGDSTKAGAFTSAHQGYGKDYRYDTRLNFRQPPFFLKPTVSQWTVRSWSELVGS
ncbi:hypothetical protein CLV35_1454 [Motilibacter peucedani]|uniref:Uncharacterized protein n=1 Tax=Motilibacter peucedani TaxID=598650 RepID=A0A420XSA4_9ACTN|nr:PilX N-terminal domain-containing pilus assembly protein [Motilibacter peucedani]RKS77756.1 hypothetical protein CLV35_1454 [Motilibacter peucedani]